jgi:hypothetical protein
MSDIAPFGGEIKPASAFPLGPAYDPFLVANGFGSRTIRGASNSFAVEGVIKAYPNHEISDHDVPLPDGNRHSIRHQVQGPGPRPPDLLFTSFMAVDKLEEPILGRGFYQTIF